MYTGERQNVCSKKTRTNELVPAYEATDLARPVDGVPLAQHEFELELAIALACTLSFTLSFYASLEHGCAAQIVCDKVGRLEKEVDVRG